MYGRSRFYLIYARKIYVPTDVKDTRQWKSTFKYLSEKKGKIPSKNLCSPFCEALSFAILILMILNPFDRDTLNKENSVLVVQVFTIALKGVIAQIREVSTLSAAVIRLKAK